MDQVEQEREVICVGTLEQFQVLVEIKAEMQVDPFEVSLGIVGPFQQGDSICYFVYYREILSLRSSSDIAQDVEQAVSVGLDPCPLPPCFGQVCASELPQGRIRLLFKLKNFPWAWHYWGWAEELVDGLSAQADVDMSTFPAQDDHPTEDQDAHPRLPDQADRPMSGNEADQPDVEGDGAEQKRMGRPKLDRDEPSEELLDTTGGKYGTYRDLTIEDVRAIVAQCLQWKRNDGKIPEFYRRKNVNPGEPRSYTLDTLRGWLKDSKFHPHT